MVSLPKPKAPPGICDVQGTIGMSKQFGRTNNVMIEYSNLLMKSTTTAPRQRVLIPEPVKQLIGKYFDLHTATRSWACVVDNSSLLSSDNVVMYPSGQIYSWYDQLSRSPSHFNVHAHNDFRPHVFAQILLRPLEPLRSYVDNFIRDHLASPHGYIALHLRFFEGGCVSWFNKKFGFSFKSNVRKYMPNGRPVTAEDVCSMSDDLIDAALLMAGSAKVRPIFLAHDRQQKDRAHAIQKKYNAVTYEGPHGAYVDQLLLLQSSFMVGSPSSSFSMTAAAARWVMLHDEERDFQTINF